MKYIPNNNKCGLIITIIITIIIIIIIIMPIIITLFKCRIVYSLIVVISQSQKGLITCVVYLLGNSESLQALQSQILLKGFYFIQFIDLQGEIRGFVDANVFRSQLQTEEI